MAAFTVAVALVKPATRSPAALVVLCAELTLALGDTAAWLDA